MRTTPADDRNIVLTGFMGTGKSTVGRLVAARLGRRFVDTDEVITERHGPIPEIFAAVGEEAFRAMEREVAAELAAARSLVIATGGRLLLDPVNAEVLGRHGVLVCLVASPQRIVERVTGDGVEGRPLLAVEDPAARVAELLAERAEGYARFPQLTTDDRTPQELADRIVAMLDGDAGPPQL